MSGRPPLRRVGGCVAPPLSVELPSPHSLALTFCERTIGTGTNLSAPASTSFFTTSPPVRPPAPVTATWASVEKGNTGRRWRGERATCALHAALPPRSARPPSPPPQSPPVSARALGVPRLGRSFAHLHRSRLDAHRAGAARGSRAERRGRDLARREGGLHPRGGEGRESPSLRIRRCVSERSSERDRIALGR